MAHKKIIPHVALQGGAAMSVVHHVQTESRDVIVKRELFRDVKKKLPKPEMYDLEVQLRNNIPLQEVNSVVFHVSELSEQEMSKVQEALDAKEESKEEPLNE